MKKVLRKTVLIIAVITMLLLASISSEAATEYTSGDWTYTINNNVATITGYKGSESNITLPTSLGGYPVKHVGSSSFENNTSITSVVIPESFITIGDYAFKNCSYLKTVKIPKSIQDIGTGSYSGSCFENCIRLETVTLTEGGTAETEIHNSAFRSCTALKSITIPSNYRNTGSSAFEGCTSLKTVVIKSNSDVAFERTVDYRSFYGCTVLLSIEIPEGFTTIGDSAFANCAYLKTVTIPKSIKQIGTGSYTGNSFENCIRLETVTLAEGGTAEAEIHTAAFANCTALKSITIPANYKNTGNNAFAGCTSLKTVVIKGNSDLAFERTVDYRSFYGCTALLSIEIPEGFITIDDSAFMNCSYLKTVKIPKSIKQIGTGSYTGNCFENCIRLETVTLTEGGTAEAEIHTAAFANCTALKSITIPANYKNTGNNAFAGCTSLKIVVIKDNSDGYFERKIDYRSFYGCTALTTVHIPVNIKSIDSTAFTNCSKSLTLCSKSSVCLAKEYAQNNSLAFKVCDGTHTDEKPITYTLSYNANGGNGAPASQSGATNYIVSNTQPTRSGYTFLGWSKSSSAIAASYKAGDSITLIANTTLYAVWKKNAVVPTPVELPEIKINRTSTNKINFGDTLVLQLEEIEIPEGYAVAWLVEGAGVSTWVSEDGLECRVTSIANGNPTIYAKLVDEEENVVTNADGEEIFDEITLTSKAGFWQRFISFFKNLFGINRVIY